MREVGSLYEKGQVPFPATNSGILAAMVRLRRCWERIKPEVEAKEYKPNREAESRAMVSVLYRHLYRRWAIDRIRKSVEGWNRERQATAAFSTLSKRKGQAYREGRTQFGDAVAELEREARCNDHVKKLCASWSIRLGKGEATQFGRRHRRWYVSSGDIAERSYTSPPSEGHTNGCPKEVPAHTVGLRLAQVCGDRPVKVSRGYTLPLGEYLYKHEPAVLDRMPRGMVYTPTGSFEASAPHLAKYYGEPPPSPPSHEIDKVVRDTVHTLKIQQLGPLSRDAFWTTGVNPSSAPGFDSKAYAKTKGKAFDVAAIACQQIWDELGSRQLIDTSVWELGGREKRQWRELGEQLTSRVIMMPEAILSQFGCAIAHPITLAIQRARGDLRVGWSYAHGKWKELFDYFDLPHVKAFDWSQFDARVGEDLIVCSMGILRAFYPQGRQMDRAFLYLLSNLVIKDVVVPGGYVSRVRWGVPSGHPFTSLIDSVANWLIHRSVLRRLCGPRIAARARLAVLGDDTLLGFRSGGDAPETPAYLKCASEMWGAIGKVDFNLEGFFSSNFAQGCLPFLGTRFQAGLPGVSLEDWVTMDLGDKAPRTDYVWRALEVWVYRGLPPFCREQWDLHSKLCSWSRSRDPDAGLVLSEAALQATIEEAFRFAAIVYLTAWSGHYAWAEDMSGVRRTWETMGEGQRFCDPAAVPPDIPGRLAGAALYAYGGCLERAMTPIGTDPAPSKGKSSPRSSKHKYEFAQLAEVRSYRTPFSTL